MAEIKKVPAIRFKGFGDAWYEKHLSEIATMKARIGWQGLTKKEYLNSGNFYLITGTDFLDGTIDFRNCHYVNEDRYAQDANIQINNDDVLITKDGTIGKVAYVENLDKPATLNAGVFVIRGNDKSICNLYLYQYLAAPFLLDFAYKQATGGTIKHLNQNVLVKFPVPISNINEQIQIGSYFQHLDKLISLHQAKVNKLTNLKKAMLEKIFPKQGEDLPEIRFQGFEGAWKKLKLGDIGTVLMNKRIFKSQTSEIGDVPFYKIGTFGSEPNSYISRELFEEYKTKYPYPKKGDLLISAAGSIGKVVEYIGEDEYFQDSNIVWLDHDETLINSFLKQFYLSVRWGGLEGSTIKRLYNKDILETPINLPSIKEQIKIGDYFQNLDKIITLHQTELEKLSHLKKACLEKMFV
jgi:type I restriction enzyme S subunit